MTTSPIVCCEFPATYPHHAARMVSGLLARALGPDSFERRHAVGMLEARQIRGGLERDAASWTGYDYVHQCWLVARRVDSIPEAA